MTDPNALDPNAVRGDAAGVPFIALPPVRPHDETATVIVWHMRDPPRSETAMAAALPLRGVDAWRAYLGLPLSGSRLPDGGLDGFFALGYEDAVLKLYSPTVRQAVEEFPAALAELQRRTVSPRVPSRSSALRSELSSHSAWSPPVSCRFRPSRSSARRCA